MEKTILVTTGTGWAVDSEKYNEVRRAILASLEFCPLTYTQIVQSLGARLRSFPGSLRWYAEVVKLDVEARQLIERVPGSPQLYRLKQHQKINRNETKKYYGQKSAHR